MRPKRLNANFKTERQRELIARAQAGDNAARDTLLTENEPLVKMLVSYYLPFCTSHEFEDLQQAGRIGLWKAIIEFDLSRDVQFSTFATCKIRGGITGQMRFDRMIHIPAHVTGTEKGRARMPVLPVCLESLDQPAGANRNDGATGHLASLGDLLTAPNDTEAEALAELPEEIRTAIDALPEHQRQVMIWRYGLDDGERLTLREVGDKLGMSREGVRHREVAAIIRLRRALGVKP